MGFTKLGLAPEVMEGIRAMGYTQPTPIQAQTIPLLLEGRDVIGSAQTGTGKTAAFALPILSRLATHGPGPRVLVLEPTRELAAQVDQAFRDLSRFTNLRVGCVYGGVGYGRQNDALRAGVDILVATPGRLLDHLGRRTVSLDRVQFLVLDEADRMLDMGFMPDVRRIIQQVPPDRQTSLFSATIPPDIEALIRWAMRSPQVVEIGHRRSPAETVRHFLYPVAENQKTDLLLALLDQVHYESVIVFCRTRHRADRIGQVLKRGGHSVATLHSDRTQKERERALQGFREGRYEVLVATDIAARGLDIADVSHVINCDVPQHPEDYVHRIGRTGRAAATGDAFTLMVSADIVAVSAIERFIGKRIERARLESFAYQDTAAFAEPRPVSAVNRRPSMPSGRHFAPRGGRARWKRR